MQMIQTFSVHLPNHQAIQLEIANHPTIESLSEFLKESQKMNLEILKYLVNGQLVPPQYHFKNQDIVNIILCQKKNVKVQIKDQLTKHQLEQIKIEIPSSCKIPKNISALLRNIDRPRDPNAIIQQNSDLIDTDLFADHQSRLNQEILKNKQQIIERANEYLRFSTSYHTSYILTSQPGQTENNQEIIRDGKKMYKKQKKKEDKRLQYVDNSDYEYDDGYDDTEEDAKQYLRQLLKVKFYGRRAPIGNGEKMREEQ